MGDPEARRSKGDSGLSSLPYAFLNLGCATAHCEPRAGAWVPTIMSCRRELHADGFWRPQPGEPQASPLCFQWSEGRKHVAMTL